MATQEEDVLAYHPSYESLCRLGEGTFGTVYMARKRQANERGERTVVAVKLVKGGRQAIGQNVENEIIIQSKCYHPHIVILKDVIRVPSHLGLVLEYVPGGTLFDLVDKRRGIPEAQARWIFQQLILGVDYLHNMGIAQRDIKLENILVTNPESSWPNIKITDFGFCKGADQSACKTKAGTCAYMAPEIYGSGKNHSYCGKRADMWSSGVLLYVMLFYRYPFDITENDQPGVSPLHSTSGNAEMLMRAQYILPGWPHVSESCKHLLQHLIHADPNSRYTAEQCINHPWFKQNLPAKALEYNAKYLAESKGRVTAQQERKFRQIVAAARGSDCMLKSGDAWKLRWGF